MFKKAGSIVLAAALAAGLLAGCGSSTQTDQKVSSGSGQVSAEKKTGSEGDKVVRIGGTGAVIDSIDPAKDWCGWYPVRYGVAETLFKLDENLDLQPWLAESFEQVDDLTWKINLKKDVTFSNGEAMTADKVIASLKRAGENNVRAASLAGAEMTAEENAVIIRTSEPYTAMLNDLTDPYSAIVDVEHTEDFDMDPICTGPFVVEEYSPEESVTVVKNENYWGGEVKADRVEYMKVADFNTLALSLQGGEVDVALDLSPEAAQTLTDFEGVTLTATTQPRVYQLYFNLEKMTDKAVREAIIYGIDKDTIGNVQLKGAVVPAKGAFLDNTVFGGKDLEVRGFDEAKAKETLDKAGYRDSDGDGIVEKDGSPLTVKLNVYQRLAMESIATELQAQMKKIGIDLQVEVSEKATYFEGGDFELGIYSIVTTPTGNPYIFLRDCMQTDGVANYGGYESETVQKDLTELRTTFDETRQAELVRNIQQEALNDAAYDFLGFNTMYTGLSDRVSGYVTAPNDYYQVTKDLDITE